MADEELAPRVDSLSLHKSRLNKKPQGKSGSPLARGNDLLDTESGSDCESETESVGPDLEVTNRVDSIALAKKKMGGSGGARTAAAAASPLAIHGGKNKTRFGAPALAEPAEVEEAQPEEDKKKEKVRFGGALTNMGRKIAGKLNFTKKRRSGDVQDPICVDASGLSLHVKFTPSATAMAHLQEGDSAHSTKAT